MTELRARKRVSQACIPCSRKKSKCDGGYPTCGRCRLDSLECVYGTSKRNSRQKVRRPLVASSSGHQEDSFVSTASPTVTQTNHLQDCDIRSLPTGSAAVPASKENATLLPRPTADLTIVSREVSARLFKAFFTTIHPIWPILYKPLYELEDYDLLSDKLSPPLLYAIYSIAACVEPQYHRKQESRDKDVPAPALLFEAALLALQRVGSDGENNFHPLNLLKPSIETCQALTILALQQHGVAESTCAILLCGLASAMAVELRLHKAGASGTDPVQVQICSRLWWNLFVLDKMLSCEIGRPVVLRSEETDTPFPSATESDEYQLIRLSPAGTDRPISVKTQTLSGFKATIKISCIMEKVSRQIYSLSARAAIRNNLLAGEEIRMALWKELQDYHIMLETSPLKLSMDHGAVAAPVMITNMVWIWVITILLHRPFISYWEKYGRPFLNGSSTVSDPLDVCVVASNNICAILERHADNLSRSSCDLIFPIFTAASTLSHYSKQVGREGTETQRRINLCVRWLRILGNSWKNAGVSQQKFAQDLRLSSLTQNHTVGHPARYNAPRPIQYASATETSNVDASNLLSLSGHQSSIGLEGTLATIDDWSFLSSLGESADDLYSMDADFRDVLENGLDLRGL